MSISSRKFNFLAIEQADLTVVGPVTSTDEAIVRWDGTGGDVLQDSSVLIDDSDQMTGLVKLTMEAATPTIEFKDTDATDTDVNANITVQLTDTGTGAEDADMTFSAQTAGVLTQWLKFNADGSIELDPQGGAGVIIQSTDPILSFKDESGTDADINARIAVSLSDTGSGTEDADMIFRSQIAGTLTTWGTFVANSKNFLFENTSLSIRNTGTPQLAIRDDDGVDNQENFTLQVNLTDTGSGTEDADITMQADIAGSLTTFLNFDADGLFTLTPATDLLVTGANVTIKNTGSPTLEFKDDDATDDDINANISVNLTDTGSGTEDADVTFSAQIAGALTQWMNFDADGDVRVDPAGGGKFDIRSGGPGITFRDTDATDPDVNARIRVSLTDTGSGTEDAQMFFGCQEAGTFVEWGSWSLSVFEFNSSTLSIKNTGTPKLTFRDDDATDNDVNASFDVNLSDTGSGTEDADVIISAQIAGSLTEFFKFDADGDFTVTPAGTGCFDVSGGRLSLNGVGPVIRFRDSDATDGDVNATIFAAATDTGSGTEDIDMTFTAQIAGTLTNYMEFDADGLLTLTPATDLLVTGANLTIENSGSPTLEFKDEDGTDADVNANIVVNLTDTGSGTEDADVIFSAQVAGALTQWMKFNADGVLELDPGNIGQVQIQGSLPGLLFKDTDGTDADLNGQIRVNLTDTGSGTEDVNMSFEAQSAGALVVWGTYAGSGGTFTFTSTDVLTNGGNLTIRNTGQPSIALKDDDATDNDNNCTIDINATDTGSGTEDIDYALAVQVAGTLTDIHTYDASEDITDIDTKLTGWHYALNAQTGTTYTVVAADEAKIVSFSNAAAITVTLPQTSTTVLDAGFHVQFQNIGDGLVTVVKEGADVLNNQDTVEIAKGDTAFIFKSTAGTPNTYEMTGGSPKELLQFPLLIEAVADQDYPILTRYGGDEDLEITETTSDAASGTCTATFKINTTGLGGTANSVSSTETTQSHTSANTVTTGDNIIVTVSANSTCIDMTLTVTALRFA